MPYRQKDSIVADNMAHRRQPPADPMAYVRTRVPEAATKAGTSNYIPQYLWDVITCPCLSAAQVCVIIPR